MHKRNGSGHAVNYKAIDVTEEIVVHNAIR